MLDTIVAHRRQFFASAGKISSADLPVEPLQQKRFLQNLGGDKINIIGEIKPMSPVSGRLGNVDKLDDLLSIYKKRCAAVSVLTEEKFFGGSFELLERVAETTGLPVLCKDFVIDRKQVRLARKAGSEAILLIVKILSSLELQHLVDEAKSHGLEPVVEVNDEAELNIALSLDVNIVLINNRNLSTMDIDLETTVRLTGSLRKRSDNGNAPTVISASGITNSADVEKLSLCTNNFLVGSALMRSERPDELLDSLIGSTRGGVEYACR